MFCFYFQLPLKIDIIKHPNETDGKSTAVHAKLLACEDVTVYTYPCIPDYDNHKHEVSVHIQSNTNDYVVFPKCPQFSIMALFWYWKCRIYACWMVKGNRNVRMHFAMLALRTISKGIFLGCSFSTRHAGVLDKPLLLNFNKVLEVTWFCFNLAIR